MSFGGTPATSFTVNSATQITAVTPARSAGTVSVTVTTAGGTSNGVAFTYVAVPTLTAITPERRVRRPAGRRLCSPEQI